MTGISIELTEEQIEAIVDAVEARLAKRRLEAFEAPLTVKEFADKVNLSERSVYRMVDDKEIERVSGISKILIPARELKRFM